jgi:hypothetical protein
MSAIGLPKKLWEEFNFEEGLSGVSEERREGYLKHTGAGRLFRQTRRKGLGL